MEPLLRVGPQTNVCCVITATTSTIMITRKDFVKPNNNKNYEMHSSEAIEQHEVSK